MRYMNENLTEPPIKNDPQKNIPHHTTFSYQNVSIRQALETEISKKRKESAYVLSEQL